MNFRTPAAASPSVPSMRNGSPTTMRAADDDTGRLGNDAAGVGHGYPNAFLSDVQRQNPHADFLAAVIRSSRTLAVTTSFTSARTTDGSLTPPCPILSCPPPPPPCRFVSASTNLPAWIAGSELSTTT